MFFIASVLIIGIPIVTLVTIITLYVVISCAITTPLSYVFWTLTSVWLVIGKRRRAPIYDRIKLELFEITTYALSIIRTRKSQSNISLLLFKNDNQKTLIDKLTIRNRERFIQNDKIDSITVEKEIIEDPVEAIVEGEVIENEVEALEDDELIVEQEIIESEVETLEDDEVIVEQEIIESEVETLEDDEVIDQKEILDNNDVVVIDNNSLNMEIPKSKDNSSGDLVPHWSQEYVYDTHPLSYATKIQKKFYNFYKEKIFRGEKVDIQNNSNYAFILYFELIKIYKFDNDISSFVERIQLVNESCSKVSSYSLETTIYFLNNSSSKKAGNILKKFEDPNYLYSNSWITENPFQYSLGTILEDALTLKEKEIYWLNKIHYEENTFNTINGIISIIVKFYNKVISEFEKDNNLEEIIYPILELNKKQINIDFDYKLTYFKLAQANNYIFSTIFRKIENHVRTALGNTRLLSTSYPLKNVDIREMYMNSLEKPLDLIIENLSSKIEEPDYDTLIELNSHYHNRWKVEINIVKKELSAKNISKFKLFIDDLEKVNIKNPKIENIFFEAVKIVAKLDRQLALEYYLRYFSYNLNSSALTNKDLSATSKKQIFGKTDLYSEFLKIQIAFINNRNLKQAIEDINQLFKPKRKRIVINPSEIKEAEEKHTKTIDLLSNYLEEDDSIIQSIIETEKVITIEKDSFYKIQFSNLEIEIIQEFVNKDFTIEQSRINEIAVSNNTFKNKLVDNINNLCSEILDGEMLIEEDDEDYIIEESFYQDIIN